MKVLLLSLRNRFPAGFEAEVRDQLGLGPDVELSMLTVVRPRRVLDLDAVHVVGLSRIPGRPALAVPVTHEPGAAPTGWRRGWARLHRRLGRIAQAIPVPQSWRVTRRSALTGAAITSPDVRRLARAADVVVPLEVRASYAAWQLSRRVTAPTYANLPGNVRPVLVGRGIEVGPRPARGPAVSLRESIPPLLRDDPAPHRLLIGPANFAGQGAAWARAVDDHVADARAVSFSSIGRPRGFDVDYDVEPLPFDIDLSWRLAWRRKVVTDFTHVLIEANRPVLGAIAGTGEQHAHELVRRGISVGLVSHGTDARVPSLHAAAERWHPYDGLRPNEVQRMEVNARANVAFYASFEGPVFVSTLGLLEFVPRATWLPVVVQPELWHREDEPMARPVPVVAHVPSGPQKGSHMIDPILTGLAERGLIEYLRVEGVPFKDMPELYGGADIVVDQFGAADYGAAACEAMAAGRVVVSRVADGVRAHVLATSGLQLPVVEADPETLEDVILGLVADRDRARAVAENGPGFVAAVHDGRMSAAVLAGWLDAPASRPGS